MLLIVVLGADSSLSQYWGANTSPKPEELTWKLPAIVGGVIAGVVLIVTLVGACVYRYIRITRVIKRSEGENTSPNHVVMQVAFVILNVKTIVKC